MESHVPFRNVAKSTGDPLFIACILQDFDYSISVQGVYFEFPNLKNCMNKIWLVIYIYSYIYLIIYVIFAWRNFRVAQFFFSSLIPIYRNKWINLYFRSRKIFRKLWRWRDQGMYWCLWVSFFEILGLEFQQIIINWLYLIWKVVSIIIK